MTKAVFDLIYSNIQRLHVELGESAGSDSLQDRWKCGVIAGYNDLLNIEFGEVSHDD